MPQLLLITVLFLGLALNALLALADSQPVPVPNGSAYTAQRPDTDGHLRTVPLIVFDAQPTDKAGTLSGPGFISPTPTLRDGSPVEVRIYNPNSFLNSYDITCNSLDYHTSAMPPVLSSLLTATRGRAGAPVVDLTQPLTPLQRDYEEFENAYANEFGDTDNPKDAGRLLDCLNGIVTAITEPGATNVSIRKTAVVQVSALVRRDVLTPNFTDTISGDHSAAVTVTDFSPSQQSDLQNLLTALRGHDTTQIAADYATLQHWYDAWNADYFPKGSSGGNETRPIESPDAHMDLNDIVQKQWAEANTFKDGSSAMSALVTLFAAAIDLSATPPFYVSRVDHISGEDVARFQVTVSGKPPNSNYAQVDVDNTRLGIAGTASHPYSTDADIYGRTVLDVSAGLVLTSLTNRNYYGQAASSAAGAPKIIHQGASDSVDFSVGPLATLYKTQQSGLAIGPSLGASAGSGARYLIGLSAVSTIHHSRLLLTVGGASGSVTELANGDQVGKAANTGTVSTNSVQRFGGFVALSWSIFTN